MIDYRQGKQLERRRNRNLFYMIGIVMGVLAFDVIFSIFLSLINYIFALLITAVGTYYFKIYSEEFLKYMKALKESKKSEENFFGNIN